MPNFTKGKWGFFRNGDGTYSITGNGGQVIGECFTGDFDVDVEEAEANATLIAYAPKMYELLKALERDLHIMPHRRANDVSVLLNRIDGKEDKDNA